MGCTLAAAAAQGLQQETHGKAYRHTAADLLAAAELGSSACPAVAGACASCCCTCTCRRQALENRVEQVEDVIQRKLVEEKANEQAAEKKGVS